MPTKLSCRGCSNEDQDWFVQNKRTGSYRCTRCGSYDIAQQTWAE